MSPTNNTSELVVFLDAIPLDPPNERTRRAAGAEGVPLAAKGCERVLGDVDRLAAKRRQSLATRRVTVMSRYGSRQACGSSYDPDLARAFDVRVKCSRFDL
jgi:hypothetical protein